jgi:hypothetical protein
VKKEQLMLRQAYSESKKHLLRLEKAAGIIKGFMPVKAKKYLRMFCYRLAKI